MEVTEGFVVNLYSLNQATGLFRQRREILPIVSTVGVEPAIKQAYILHSVINMLLLLVILFNVVGGLNNGVGKLPKMGYNSWSSFRLTNYRDS